tara:strand:- start:7293 stop:7508 length:216 start_codon:yes stop_codon:yes gene_type:complete
MFKRFAKTALKGFAKKQKKFANRPSAKDKRIKKENKKVAGVGVGITGGTAGYLGFEYGMAQKNYPETGKNR